MFSPPEVTINSEGNTEITMLTLDSHSQRTTSPFPRAIDICNIVKLKYMHGYLSNVPQTLFPSCDLKKSILGYTNTNH